MTKEEFLSMLSNELEKLEQEKEDAQQRVSFFEQADPNGKLYEEAEYKLNIINNRCAILRNLVSLPAYARVQAMSDIEIEEYRKSKLEELELYIKESKDEEKVRLSQLKTELDQLVVKYGSFKLEESELNVEEMTNEEKAKLAHLRRELDQLAVKYGGLTGNEREEAIRNGRELFSWLWRYGDSDKYYTYSNLDEFEIEEIRAEYEQIQAMTSQELKQQMLSKIKGNEEVAVQLKEAERYISGLERLEASVASDPEKAMQMAKLIISYNDMVYQQSILYAYYNGPEEVPRQLKEKLLEDFAPDKNINIINQYEGSFEQAKSIFMELFTEEKISEMHDYESHMLDYENRRHDQSLRKRASSGKVYEVEVDMEFFQKHADKLKDGKLDKLQTLLDQRKKINRKIFKTSKVKNSLQQLNDKIDILQSNIYFDITEHYNQYYKAQCLEVLNIKADLIEEMRNPADSADKCLEKLREAIGRTEQAIAKLKDDIQKNREELEQKQQLLDQKRQSFETKKVEIIQQIRNLAGEKFRGTEVRRAFGFSLERRLDEIADSDRSVYREELVGRVQQEAQRQADIREAELRGITVEQLMQLRQQAALANAQGQNDEAGEEESPRGVSR